MKKILLLSLLVLGFSTEAFSYGSYSGWGNWGRNYSRGCSNGQQIAREAQDLAQSSRSLAQRLRGSSHLEQNLKELARTAHQLRRQALGSASCDQLQQSFHYVQREFNDIQYAMRGNNLRGHNMMGQLQKIRNDFDMLKRTIGRDSGSRYGRNNGRWDNRRGGRGNTHSGNRR